MRQRFDQVGKGIAEAALSDLGKVIREAEVTVPTQRLDICFQPDPSKLRALSERGLLGRMAMEIFAMELFSKTPGIKTVGDCVRKHDNWHHQETLKARREGHDRRLELSTRRLWVVTPGRPDGAIAVWAMSPAKGWPTGVYSASTNPGLWVVVLSELSRTRETLALRAMGRGATLRGAVEELIALPRASWEWERVAPVLVQWQMLLGQVPRGHDARTEEEMAAGMELVEEFERKAILKGLRKGRRAGLRKGVEKGLEQGLEQGLERGLEPLARLFERRLGRTLTDADRATLLQRLDALGPARLGDVVLDLDPAQLGAWLADPNAV